MCLRNDTIRTRQTAWIHHRHNQHEHSSASYSAVHQGIEQGRFVSSL